MMKQGFALAAMAHPAFARPCRTLGVAVQGMPSKRSFKGLFNGSFKGFDLPRAETCFGAPSAVDLESLMSPIWRI